MLDKKRLLQLISTFPARLQDLIGDFNLAVGFPLMVGPIRYLRFRHFLKKSQRWPRWKLERYQLDKLRQLLSHAYKNVPYYTELFNKLNVTPEDFHHLGDLTRLPVLTKEDVVNNFDKLIARNINKKYLKLISTSGSTGKPIQFYRDNRYNFVELSLFRKVFDSLNIKHNDKRVDIVARIFLDKKIKDWYFYEPHLKKLSLSYAPSTLGLYEEYLKLIRKFNPVLCRGNPSLLYHLACYAQENSINDIHFKYFISSYEQIFPYQRDLIEKQFNCEIYSYYGSEEYIISAFECSQHNGMHINMERGILEILGDSAEPLPEGYSGRVIVTGLHNYGFPFIRYEMEDIASISRKPCPCGLGLPLLKSLDGRKNEFLKYKDKIAYSGTLSIVISKFYHIKECQFIQEFENEVKVNIIKRQGYSEKDTQDLISALKDMLDERLNITINFLDYIPRTKMGKFPFVVSKINQ